MKKIIYKTLFCLTLAMIFVIMAQTFWHSFEMKPLKNARKTLFSEPEKYFNDLSTNDIPVKRNKRIKAIMKKYYDIEID